MNRKKWILKINGSLGFMCNASSFLKQDGLLAASQRFTSAVVFFSHRLQSCLGDRIKMLHQLNDYCLQGGKQTHTERDHAALLEAWQDSSGIHRLVRSTRDFKIHYWTPFQQKSRFNTTGQLTTSLFLSRYSCVNRELFFTVMNTENSSVPNSDPSIIKQNSKKKPWIILFCDFFMPFYLWRMM
jgi:hypothetical protein